jgi:serine/threonine protein kinase
LQGVLGKGSFGKVVQAQKKGTKDQVAIKMIPIGPLKKNDLITQIVNEVKIMSLLTSCKHIVKLIDFFEDENNLYLVMELANQGTLMDMLNKYGKLKEKVAAKIMRDIILAVEFLHAKNIIHRDLKPENVLLTSEGHAKLSDFGWSSKLANNDDRRRTFCGTPDYISPEMIDGKEYDSSVDIWCLGVMLYEMLHGLPPFTPIGDHDSNTKEKKIYDNIKKMRIQEPSSAALSVVSGHARKKPSSSSRP